MAKRKPKSNATASLIAALKFIAPTQKKNGTIEQQFCIIFNHWLIASNGILTAACPVQDDLNACPHSLLLLEALKECGEELVITQLDKFNLSVRSGEFKAIIACVSFDEIYNNDLAPDAICANIDNKIKDALNAVLVVADDVSSNVAFSSVLLQSGSAVATNGVSLLEYWHGIDLPPNMLIPKASAKAIAKQSKNLVGFGYSGSSATFHFEDGSFYKTQLFNERYPAYENLFPVSVDPWPLPLEFWQAVETIAVFSKEGKLFFEDGLICSHEQESQASTYRLDGLPDEMGFNAKNLMRVKHAMQTAAFYADRGEVIFFGENIRGILKGLDLKAKKENAQKIMPNVDSDDIPF